MKINFKVRMTNKAWLITFAAAVLSFLYYLAEIIGIDFPIDNDTLMKAIMLFIDILVILGVVIDPTTDGTSDSKRVLYSVDKN